MVVVTAAAVAIDAPRRDVWPRARAVAAQAQRQGLSRLTGGRRKDKAGGGGGNNGKGGALLALSIRSEMHAPPSISNLMTFAGQLLDTVMMWGHDSRT